MLSQLPGEMSCGAIHRLFLEYSEPWEAIARNMVLDVCTKINSFASEALQHFTDAHTAATIFNLWLAEKLANNAKAGYAELDKLLRIQNEAPFTRDRRYMAGVARIKIEEQEKQQKQREMQPNADPRTANETVAKMSIQKMQAYYEVSHVLEVGLCYQQ